MKKTFLILLLLLMSTLLWSPMGLEGQKTSEEIEGLGGVESRDVPISTSPILNASCVYYDKSLLVSPCQAYNPSSWAYVPHGVDLASWINDTNVDINAVKSLFGSNYNGTCGNWVLFLCQHPNLLTGFQPMQNCPVDAAFEPPAVPFPVPICRDMCERFVSNCRADFEQFHLENLLPATFCDSYSNEPVVQRGVEYPCWNATPGAYVPYNETRCRKSYTKQKGTTCFPTCPSAAYTSSQLDVAAILQQVPAWISLVSSLVLIVLLLLSPSARRFPPRLILFSLLATLPLSLAFVLPTFVGGSLGPVLCGSVDAFSRSILAGGDKAINNQGLCVFQGWSIQVGTLMSVYWWAALSWHMCLVVRATLAIEEKMKVFLESPTIETLFHCVCWGAPLTYGIVAAAAGKIDYEAVDIFCFLNTTDNLRWLLALWVVPIGIGVLLGTAGTCWCTYMLIQQARTPSAVDTPPQLYQLIARLLLLNTFFLAIYLLLMITEIYAAAFVDNNGNQLFAQFFCFFSSSTLEECRDILYENTNLSAIYALSVASSFCMALLGSTLVIFCLTSRSLFQAITFSHNNSSPTREST